MEITTDKKGKSLLVYNSSDILNTKNALSQIMGISQIQSDESKNMRDGTCTNYLKFNLHGVKFKIRMSVHSYNTFPNETLEGCRYARGYWTIDASIGRYTPSEIPVIVKNINTNLNKYQDSIRYSKLEQFARTKLSEDYYIEDMDDKYASEYLSDEYIQDQDLTDDKYRTTNKVLNKIFYDLLVKIGSDDLFPGE